MHNQSNRPANGMVLNPKGSLGPIIEIGENGDVIEISDGQMPTPPKERGGFFQQLAGLAQSLLPDQKAKVTITTVEISSKPSSATPQPPPARTEKSPQPVGPRTARRLLNIAHEKGKLGKKYVSYLDFHTERDGTTTCLILDEQTGYMQKWMICPITHRPKHLGWVNE